MPDLIDREALHQRINKMELWIPLDENSADSIVTCALHNARWILHLLDDMPTIEAEPTSCEYWDSESNFCALRRPQAEPKHGHWIDTGYGCKCSVCETPYRWNEADTMKFCKECGAKMDGGEK